MSYTEEVYERVVAQNPNEPEFHQAVKEVLDSLKVVIDKNEEKYRKGIFACQESHNHYLHLCENIMKIFA